MIFDISPHCIESETSSPPKPELSWANTQDTLAKKKILCESQIKQTFVPARRDEPYHRVERGGPSFLENLDNNHKTWSDQCIALQWLTNGGPDNAGHTIISFSKKLTGPFVPEKRWTSPSGWESAPSFLLNLHIQHQSNSWQAVGQIIMVTTSIIHNPTISIFKSSPATHLSHHLWPLTIATAKNFGV